MNVYDTYSQHNSQHNSQHSSLHMTLRWQIKRLNSEIDDTYKYIQMGLVSPTNITGGQVILLFGARLVWRVCWEKSEPVTCGCGWQPRRHFCSKPCMEDFAGFCNMEVSWNRGTLKSSISRWHFPWNKPTSTNHSGVPPMAMGFPPFFTSQKVSHQRHANGSFQLRSSRRGPGVISWSKSH